MFAVSQYAAIAIGAFYVFAGFIVLRAMLLDRVMDQLLAALKDPVAPKEALRSRVLTIGGYLTLTSGVALAVLSPLAVLLFAANALWQGAYLVWAERALPPEEEGEAKGRQRTKNAFVVYLAVTAFVIWLASRGQLRRWDAPFAEHVLDVAIVSAAIAAVLVFLHRRGGASRATGEAAHRGIEIHTEESGDVDAIRTLTQDAFATAPHASGAEANIIDALREAGALSLSLVAVDGDAIVGHVAFSPITIDGQDPNWYGLGPVAVLPSRQRQGIADALIREGLRWLTNLDAGGCVVLGNPAYYGRFGFEHDPSLFYAGGPKPAFQRLILNGPAQSGEVRYHAAFDV